MSRTKRKPTRVVISFDSHTPYLAFRVTSLLRELSAYGHDDKVEFHVILLGANEKSYDWESGDFDALYGGAKVHVLTDDFHGLGLRSYLSKKAMVTTWRFVKKLMALRPKMVFTGGYDRPASFAGAMLSYIMRFKIGVLWDSRFNDSESYSKRVGLERIKSFVIRRYDFFMCSGRECVDYTRFLAGAKKPAWSHAWNVVDNASIGRQADDGGADDELYKHLQIPRNAPFVFAPNRFLPKKNTEGLLDAFVRYRDRAVESGFKPVSLVLSGKGPLHDDIEKQVRDNHLEDHVHIVEWVPYHLVPRVFRLSRALILPSLFDQWGMTVNEALAAGTPVLVSNRCGAHELVKNHVNGFTFDPLDHAHLGDLILAMGHDDALCNRLRENAAPSMEAFSIRQFLDAYMEALEHYKVIDRRTAHAGPSSEAHAAAPAL